MTGPCSDKAKCALHIAVLVGLVLVAFYAFGRK